MHAHTRMCTRTRAHGTRLTQKSATQVKSLVQSFIRSWYLPVRAEGKGPMTPMEPAMPYDSGSLTRSVSDSPATRRGGGHTQCLCVGVNGAAGLTAGHRARGR